MTVPHPNGLTWGHNAEEATEPMNPSIHPDAPELAQLLQPSWQAMSDELVATRVPTCHVADEPLREKLRSVEAQIAEARDEHRAAITQRDQARAAFAGTDLNDTRGPAFKAAQAAVARVGAAEDKLAALQAVQLTTLKMLGREVPGHVQGPGAAPYPSTAGWDSAKIVDESTGVQLAGLASSRMPIGRVGLGEVASRDALAASFSAVPMAADIGGTDNMRRSSFAGIVPQLRRALRILDLLPVGTMDGATLPYTREAGSFTTAAETPEGDVKPEAALTLADAEADAKTIAHWLKIRKQALADAPALRSTIDSRLRYGVERRLQDQIVAGNGTGENILGILNTSGIGAVAYAAGELAADQVLRGLTTVFLADAEANGIVMHPNDWQAAVIAKSELDGQYYSGGPFSVRPQQMWGVPLVPSAAIPLGTVLVGDFAIGAQLFIREGVNVLLSDSDGDDFTRNRMTLLAEMRAALAVFRPAAFATVDLTA